MLPRMPRPERSFLVLDIETVLDPELPVPPAVTEPAPLPAPPHHQVVVIGVLWMDAERKIKRLGVVAEEARDEARLLADFVRFVDERRPDLVTWNGRGFDLPVIAARCLRHGIPFRHYYESKDVRYRYTADGHHDLMDFLSDFGASKSAKLDAVARLVGMPGKVGVEGKDVGPMVAAGRLAEVQAYCLSDVVQTAAVALRLDLVRGALDRERYLAAMTGLLDFIAGDARVAPVLEGLDRRRLLLEA
jgi:predicted PolB exonuclease-like 3'-5' exonuclease